MNSKLMPALSLWWHWWFNSRSSGGSMDL